MTSRQKDKIHRLQRRVDHLAERLAARDARGEVRENGDYDEAELSALRWALGVIEAADDAEILGELEARIGIATLTEGERR